MGYRDEDARTRASSRRQPSWQSPSGPRPAVPAWNNASQGYGREDAYTAVGEYGAYAPGDSYAGYDGYDQHAGYDQQSGHDGYGATAYGQDADYGYPQGDGYGDSRGYPAQDGGYGGYPAAGDGYGGYGGYPGSDGGYGGSGGYRSGAQPAIPDSYPQSGNYGYPGQDDGYGASGGYPAQPGGYRRSGAQPAIPGGYDTPDDYPAQPAGYDGSAGYPAQEGGYRRSGAQPAIPGGYDTAGDYPAQSGGYGSAAGYAAQEGGYGGYPAQEDGYGGYGGSAGSYPAQARGYRRSGAQPAIPGGYGTSGDYPAQSGGYGGSAGYPAQEAGYGRSGAQPAIPGGYDTSGDYPAQPGGYRRSGAQPAIPGGYDAAGDYPAQAGGYGSPGGYGAQEGGYGGHSGGYSGGASAEDVAGRYAGDEWYAGPGAAPGSGFADTGTYKLDARTINSYGTGSAPALDAGAPQGLRQSGQQQRYGSPPIGGYEEADDYGASQGYDERADGDPYQDRYGPEMAPPGGGGRRPGKSPGGAKRGKRPLVLSAIAVVVLGIVVAAVYVFALKPKPAGNMATSGPLPSPGTTSAATAACVKQLGQYCHIELRTDDPKPLTLDELYPPAFTNETDHGSFTRIGTKLDSTCSGAVVGQNLISALQAGKCTQVLRASYVSGNNQIMATIGVANLATTNEAHTAGKLVGTNDFVAPLSTTKGIGSKLGQGTGIVEAEYKGHYLIMIWAEFTSTKAPANNAQDQELQQFGTDLIAGTANIDLSQRMINGDSGATAA